MDRTSTVASENVLRRLRQLAESRGVSLGAVIREALDEKLEREQPPLIFVGTADDLPIDRPSAREADEQGLYRPEPHRSP